MTDVNVQPVPAIGEPPIWWTLRKFVRDAGPPPHINGTPESVREFMKWVNIKRDRKPRPLHDVVWFKSDKIEKGWVGQGVGLEDLVEVSSQEFWAHTDGLSVYHDAPRLFEIREAQREETRQALLRQKASDLRARKIIEQLQRKVHRLKTLGPPVLQLDSRYPNGAIINWDQPHDWDPDEYQVLVRSVARGSAAGFAFDDVNSYFSAASSSISSLTRSQVLTNNMLNSWGHTEPFEITVAAVRSGIGRVLARPVVYPPSDVAPIPKPEPQPQVAEAPDTQEVQSGTPSFRIVCGVAFGNLVGWMSARGEGTLVGSRDMPTCSAGRINGLIRLSDETIRISFDKNADRSAIPSKLVVRDDDGREVEWVSPFNETIRGLGYQVDYRRKSGTSYLVMRVDSAVTVEIHD